MSSEGEEPYILTGNAGIIWDDRFFEEPQPSLVDDRPKVLWSWFLASFLHALADHPASMLLTCPGRRVHFSLNARQVTMLFVRFRENTL